MAIQLARRCFPSAIPDYCYPFQGWVHSERVEQQLLNRRAIAALRKMQAFAEQYWVSLQSSEFIREILTEKFWRVADFLS